MGKAKYKVGQILLYLDKKKIFEIATVIPKSTLAAPRPPGQDEILYRVIYLPKPTTGKPSFGSYYESKINNSCIPIANTDMAQILYGIKL